MPPVSAKNGSRFWSSVVASDFAKKSLGLLEINPRCRRRRPRRGRRLPRSIAQRQGRKAALGSSELEVANFGAAARARQGGRRTTGRRRASDPVGEAARGRSRPDPSGPGGPLWQQRKKREMRRREERRRGGGREKGGRGSGGAAALAGGAGPRQGAGTRAVGKEREYGLVSL